MTFYKGLLIAFCSGLVVIGVLLCMLYGALARYEEKVQAEKVPEEITIPSLALGGDAASPEAEAPSVSEDTVSEDAAAVSGNDLPAEGDEEPSFPITDDEKMLVQKTAEDFTKAYAVFFFFFYA